MLVGAEQRYEWADGARALSLFRVRPGAEAVLEGGMGGLWSFGAVLTPFFDPVGERLTHEAGPPICFRWQEMPFVWLPIEETDVERFTQWHVRLSGDDMVRSWALSRTGEEAGGMVKCRTESGDFLTTLSPGMHRFELALSRSERGRTEAQVEYWLWQGLRGHDTSGFHFDALPKNLLSLALQRHFCKHAF